MTTDQIAKIREALSQGACYLDPDPSIKTYHTAESLRAEFMECIALSAPDAKEGQADDDELTELWAVVMEAIVEIDHGHPTMARDILVNAYDDGLPYKTRQPAAPAPEPEGEALSVYEVVHALVGQDKTDTLFDRFDITSRLSPPSPKEVPRQLVMVLSGRYMHFEAVADTFRNYGYTVKE